MSVRRILAGAAVLLTLATAVARADAIWDFQTGNNNWMSTAEGYWTPDAYRWTWTGTATPNPLTGGTSPHWHVQAQGVTATTPSAYRLTSPVLSGWVGSGTTVVPAQKVRISIAHDFLLMMGTDGRPTTTGQLEYMLNRSGTWVGVPLSAFKSGGSVMDDDPIFGPSPFKPLTIGGPLRYVDQTAYVAPTYVTPSGTAALPFVAPDGGAFVGQSAGWPTAYVPTQVILDDMTGVTATGIRRIKFRFTNLNLGSNCGVADGWNVRYVQVDFAEPPIPPVPEPASLTLGAIGLSVFAAAGVARRRRRHQRASRPSESP